MRSLALVAAAGLLVGSVAAQQYYYVPSDTPGAGTCNVIPFGTTKPSSTWENQRYQTIVTNAQLGGGNVAFNICSLAFSPCGVQTHSADYLKVTMAMTQATSLGTDFNANLANNAKVVLETTNHIWPVTANSWNNIGLQDSYPYDPSKGPNLVIEVLVCGNDRIAGTGSGFHRDVLQRVYSYGFTDCKNPPTSGSSAIGALKMRLGTDEGSMDYYGMGCGSGPLAMQAAGTPKAPGPVTLAASGGPNAGAGVIWLSFNNKLPYPINLDPPFTGCMLWCSFDIPFGIAYTGGSSTKLQFPIPRGFECRQFFAQALAFDTSAPGGLTLSDYVRVLIGL